MGDILLMGRRSVVELFSVYLRVSKELCFCYLKKQVDLFELTSKAKEGQRESSNQLHDGEEEGGS